MKENKRRIISKRKMTNEEKVSALLETFCYSASAGSGYGAYYVATDSSFTDSLPVACASVFIALFGLRVTIERLNRKILQEKNNVKKLIRK